MNSPPCLNARLFVGRDHVVVAPQGLTFPLSRIERIRPAFRANSGSRGKIQHRCCQGRIASSLNQRHTVVLLMVATSPPRSTSRAMSPQLRRDSGKPRVAGSSQAMALTSTTTLWGKNSGATRAREFLEPGDAQFEEALAPLTHHVASDVEVAWRSHRCPSPRQQGESFWRAPR